MDFRDGFCIRCAPGEAGEFIGKIVRGDPIKDFQVILNFENLKCLTEKQLLLISLIFFYSRQNKLVFKTLINRDIVTPKQPRRKS
jgi:hypothetical protein